MKLHLLLLSLLSAQLSFSQITITSSDMPSAGDTARRTQAPIQLGLNYQASGANHTWNFTNLRYQAQQVDSFLSVSSTNFIYALYFSNLPFNPNRANVATEGTAFPSNPVISITDPYNFYYRSSASYQQVGLGATFQGIPLPVSFTQKDKIYEFPLNFGDIDTSVSAWNISLPSLIYYGSNQTRINEVDGWGTLNTPYGTYQALRVKTTLIASDTIGIDSLSIGFNINRPLTREYKWLANGDIVPVLQITTTEVFGIEIVNAILFRDVVPNVNPGVLPAALCAGNGFQLPFTEQGTFNAQYLFTAGNKFTAQLSDANGDFSNPVNIGDTTSTISGNFGVVIPANTPAGNGYRIRITASNPAVTGADNGVDIRIDNGVPAASTITAGGPLTFCYGDSVELIGSPVNDAVYQWSLNGNPINGASGISISAQWQGVYTLSTINSCGSTVSNSETVTIDSLPLPSVISANGNLTFCYGDSVILSGNTVNNVSFQWVLNGNDLTGEVTAGYVASQAGNYQLNTINNCGVSSSNILTVQVDSLPLAALVTAAGDISFCDGDSVALQGSAVSGAQYQWLLDGTDIANATALTLTANQSGLYTLNTINNCGVSQSNSIQVTSNPLPGVPVIISSNDTLFTAGGFSYSWFLNGNLIPGANDSFLVAISSGDYTVSIMNQDSCTSISTVFSYVASGLSHPNALQTLSIWPNPVKEKLFIQLPVRGAYRIAILSAEGKVVLQSNGIFDYQAEIAIGSSLENGMYLLHIRDEHASYVQRFILNR